MGVKSVIDLDIDDSKWKRFSELFDKYEKQLAKTPNAWKAAGKEQAGMATQFERMSAALLAQNAQAKEQEDGDKKRHDRLKESERLWVNISKSSSTLARNVLNIGGGLVKWGSILATGLLGGSLFGIDKLAGTVSDQRRSSMGLGMSIGQQKAFDTHFGRLFNTQSVLEGVSNAQQLGNQGPLWSLGVNPNQSTEQVALATEKAVRALVLATPENQLGVLGQSRGLDQLGFNLDDLRREKHTSNAEHDAILGRYSRDKDATNVAPGIAEGWANFKTQMDSAAGRIFKVFVEGLAPLEGPLEKLSGRFVNLVQVLMEKNGPIEKGISAVADWIDQFQGKIGKPEFVDSFERILKSFSDFADKLDVIAHPIDSVLNGYGNNHSADGFASTLGGWAQRMMAGFKGEPVGVDEYKSYLGGLGQMNGLPKGLLERVFQQESGGNLHPSISAKGAIGAFQFEPGTAAQYGIDPNSPMQSARGAAQYFAEHLKKYKGDVAETLASYNYGEGNLDKVLKTHPSDWLRYVPKETQDYVRKTGGMTVTIMDATGGSPIKVMAGQGHP